MCYGKIPTLHLILQQQFYAARRNFDGPLWIQYDLFRKNKLPGSKKVNLVMFMLRANFTHPGLGVKHPSILNFTLDNFSQEWKICEILMFYCHEHCFDTNFSLHFEFSPSGILSSEIAVTGQLIDVHNEIMIITNWYVDFQMQYYTFYYSNYEGAVLTVTVIRESDTPREYVYLSEVVRKHLM